MKSLRKDFEIKECSEYWLNQINDLELREKALDNWAREGYPKNRYYFIKDRPTKENIARAIECSFFWEDSPEGSEFWTEKTEDARLNKLTI